MLRSGPIRFWRLALCGLLAASFVFAPISAEAAADQAAAQDCVAADHADDDDVDREHHHKVHKCGSCHLHVLGARTAARLSVAPAADTSLAWFDWDFASAPRGGFYRPPRA